MKSFVKKALSLLLVMLIAGSNLGALFAKAVTAYEIIDKLAVLDSNGSAWGNYGNLKPGSSFTDGQCWQYVKGVSSYVYGTTVSIPNTASYLGGGSLGEYYRVRAALTNCTYDQIVELLKLSQPGDVIGFKNSKVDATYGHIMLIGNNTGKKITFYQAASGKARKDTVDLTVAGLKSLYSFGYSGNASFSSSSYGISLFRCNRRTGQSDWVYTDEPTTPPTPTYHNPQGVVDIIEGCEGAVRVRGWAFDYDMPSTSVEIHIYIGGPSGSGEGHNGIMANIYRDDVNNAYSISGSHGYDAIVNTSLTGSQPIYVYAINLGGGDNVQIGSGTVTITPDTTAPTVTEYGIIETTQDGFTVYCYFDDNVGVTRVQFPTWTPWQGSNNGQDDLIWYEGNFNPDGKSAWARVPFTEHNNETGTYVSHMYVWDAAGNCSLVAASIVVEKDAPVISDVVISDITTTGYTLTCTVTDENSLNRVQFPSWHTWDDLIWLNGSISGSSVSCRIDIKDFANATGYYTTHIYAYDIWGNASSINAGTVYVPSENERYTITYNANGGIGAPSPNSNYVNVELSNTQPTRRGYIFLGWSESESALSAQYQPGSTISPGKSLTLYAIWKANTPVVSPSSGSSAVVDESAHLIYGLSVGTAQDCVAVTDGTAEYEYLNTKQIPGTGTKVNIYNNDNQFVDSYTVVIFGDVDGDSWYNGTDAFYVSLIVNGAIATDTLTDAQLTAADCNHDGVIDENDVALLEQAGLLLSQVDQTMPQEELQTNSAYIKYCSLIDQSIEPTESEQTPVTEGSTQTPVQPASNIWQLILDLFKRLMNYITMLF